MKRFDAGLVRAQIDAILRSWEMPTAQRTVTVDVMTETDLWGIDSHGISMLMMYEGMRRDGKLNMAAAPQKVMETAVLARIDGDAGLGHPAAKMAMDIAIEKAAVAGIGITTVHNSHHFGAAGYYARLAADRGLIGLVTSTARSMLLVPTFGAEPILGTNPISFAAPARRNKPFLLDMATTTVAGNKVKVYELQGKVLPEGWVVDADGRPVTDAAEGMRFLFERAEGGLTPMGGTSTLGSHKGYGLAVVAQILAGVLAGGAFAPIHAHTQRANGPDNIGHFFLAIDPTAFLPPGEFEEGLDAIIDTLHAVKPAARGQAVLVAGDPENANREERLRDGIPLPDTLVEKLHGVADRSGAPFLF